MTRWQTRKPPPPPLKMPREFLFDTQGFEGKHSNGLTSWLQSSHETISCSVVSLDAGGLIIRFGSCVSTEIHPGVPLPIPFPPPPPNDKVDRLDQSWQLKLSSYFSFFF